MKTYQFKLYQHKRNKHLHRTINAASSIYNHCIALHKRYYRLFGKHLNKNKLMKHIAKLRKKNEYWLLVGSQAAQDIIQRIDRAYELFFKHHKKGVRPPNFKKRIKYKSFTLKQAGYKFLDGNQLKIGKRIYKFWKSREIKGKIKTVTIKRNPLGELFIFVVTDHIDHQVITMSGKSAGFDFGLKVFLSCSDNTEVKSPLFLKQSLNDLKIASRQHSRKRKRSNSRERARKNLVRVHEKVVNRRTDWFWKLSHELTDKFDFLYFETLNLKGMQRLWGRKISDLAFAEFLKILEFVAEKKGKFVSYIDQWYPSTKTCSECNFVIDKLELSERYWVCPSCNTKHGRDSNSSINILKVGASTLRLGDVSLSQTAISA
ncbi:MAG: transposase [Xenococcaceae cyanobacterium MO_188.B29]|nr:transposase [Xenococcaceae cyanobacterium MO_188.B29]